MAATDFPRCAFCFFLDLLQMSCVLVFRAKNRWYFDDVCASRLFCCENSVLLTLHLQLRARWHVHSMNFCVGYRVPSASLQVNLYLKHPKFIIHVFLCILELPYFYSCCHSGQGPLLNLLLAEAVQAKAQRPPQRNTQWSWIDPSTFRTKDEHSNAV